MLVLPRKMPPKAKKSSAKSLTKREKKVAAAPAKAADSAKSFFCKPSAKATKATAIST